MPAEAAEIRRLETAFRDIFAGFGYGEVMTPTLEMESTLETAGEERFRKAFRFFDERGDVLVLRPEMTTPIARLVSTRMTASKPPFRLCYFANSFQPTSPQRGRQSEFLQAGLELIGGDSPASDAEVLAVLCRSLETAGLRDFAIALGESSFFRALLDSIGVAGQDRPAIFGALVNRDLVELSTVVGGLDISEADRQAIMDATALRGGSEVLIAARDLVCSLEMEQALKRLARTYYLVSRHGHAGRIIFDMGMLLDFEYYTGIVFEVLSESLGFPIGGGGRYDGLLGRFGRPLPAVGFAVGLDRLHIAVTGQGAFPISGRCGVAIVGALDSELGLADELRSAGVPVTALADETASEDTLRIAVDSGLRYVVIPESESYRLIEVAADEDGTAAEEAETREEEEAVSEEAASGEGELLSAEDLVKGLTESL